MPLHKKIETEVIRSLLRSQHGALSHYCIARTGCFSTGNDLAELAEDELIARIEAGEQLDPGLATAKYLANKLLAKSLPGVNAGGRCSLDDFNGLLKLAPKLTRSQRLAYLAYRLGYDLKDIADTLSLPIEGVKEIITCVSRKLEEEQP